MKSIDAELHSIMTWAFDFQNQDDVLIRFSFAFVVYFLKIDTLKFSSSGFGPNGLSDVKKKVSLSTLLSSLSAMRSVLRIDYFIYDHIEKIEIISICMKLQNDPSIPRMMQTNAQITWGQLILRNMLLQNKRTIRCVVSFSIPSKIYGKRPYEKSSRLS